MILYVFYNQKTLCIHNIYESVDYLRIVNMYLKLAASLYVMITRELRVDSVHVLFGYQRSAIRCAPFVIVVIRSCISQPVYVITQTTPSTTTLSIYSLPHSFHNILFNSFLINMISFVTERVHCYAY